MLVDDNNRVKKGDILIEIDKQPFQIDVDLKKAMVATAKANLLAPQDEGAPMVAGARQFDSNCNIPSKM